MHDRKSRARPGCLTTIPVTQGGRYYYQIRQLTGSSRSGWTNVFVIERILTLLGSTSQAFGNLANMILETLIRCN